MKKYFVLGLITALAAGSGMVSAAAGQEQQATAGETQAVSWDNWRAAKLKAEEHDGNGQFVEALQYYLEYIRQAEGLGRPDLVAWGKNNAAYMIIKRHKQDATVDLAPAKQMLEEGLAIDQATEDCRKLLESNMAYVKMFLDRTGLDAR
jgi:hypothetical protein